MVAGVALFRQLWINPHKLTLRFPRRPLNLSSLMKSRRRSGCAWFAARSVSDHSVQRARFDPPGLLHLEVWAADTHTLSDIELGHWNLKTL